MVSPPGLFFLFFTYFFGFSYNNLFNHLNIHDDYTSTPTLQLTPKATQRVEMAMAAAAALATGKLFFFGFYYYFH